MSEVVDWDWRGVWASAGTLAHARAMARTCGTTSLLVRSNIVIGRLVPLNRQKTPHRSDRLWILLGTNPAIYQIQAPNRSAARAFARAASSSRFFGGAVVSRERSRRMEIAATSSTAER